jgi:dTDP-4-dehydrorhamnose 3,5-epimerase
MKIISTPFEGLLLIEPQIFEDDRGYFFESFNESEMKRHGINGPFVQDNQSVSHKGVLRGLHFQKPPFQQAKLVRVVQGSVIDVVVDIRKESKTFGKHFSVELNATDKKMLWIPEGFAHGFVSLEDETSFLYKVTEYYRPMAESGIIFNDIELNIDWNIKDLIVSKKDKILPSFKEFKQGISVNQ